MHHIESKKNIKNKKLFLYNIEMSYKNCTEWSKRIITRHEWKTL